MAGVSPLRRLASGMRAVFLPEEFEQMVESGGSYQLTLEHRSLRVDRHGIRICGGYLPLGTGAMTAGKQVKSGLREARVEKVAKRSRLVRTVGWLVGILVGVLALWLVAASVMYPFEYVRRMVAWGESDVGDYLNHFPQRHLHASPQPFRFSEAPDEARVSAIFESILDVEDFDAFLETADTQAFIVIRDDEILYEHYFNGTQRDSMATSFSVAKSFDSALIGIAIDEGSLSGVDDPITDYLPERASRSASSETSQSGMC